jgi:M6 family metalloprotease-like protein
LKNEVFKTLVLFFLVCLPLTAMAQHDVVRGFCTPDLSETEGSASARSHVMRRLPAINNVWDSTRTYRQLVILLTFLDQDFSMEAPREHYDRMFNEVGYNQRNGVGCVADYFRSQSGGLFNLEFDVFGPYEVSSMAQPYDNPTSETKNYGKASLSEATQHFIDANPEWDCSPYDWNNDGRIEQVIYIYAGYTGNQNSSKSYGHIWPNTGSFTALRTADGKTISNYSASGEKWTNNALTGIGTVCHEFSHSLGLPDIYPTNDWAYSIVDEWDLMDGGNFTNYGWCPPNYTALEKMLLGWLEAEELSQPTTISGLKPVAEGGKAYIVKHTNTEYLLLENRQWRGWDAGLPNSGLVAYHVNYIPSRWSANTPNNTSGKPNFFLMDPDQMSYEEWADYLTEELGVTSQNAVYQNTGRMNSWIMSGASYPHTSSDQAIIDSLTNTSAAATEMYTLNGEGSQLLSKPITNIKESEDGLVSFDFMGGAIPTAINMVEGVGANNVTTVFDLNGRRMRHDVAGQKGMRLVRLADGTVRKLFLK